MPKIKSIIDFCIRFFFVAPFLLTVLALRVESKLLADPLEVNEVPDVDNVESVVDWVRLYDILLMAR